MVTCRVASISGHKLHRDVGVCRVISRSLLFRDFSIFFGQGFLTCLPSSQKRGHEIECIWQIDAAIKSGFCLQRGKWDWRVLGATEVLCLSGFHVCNRNPFPMLQNKIKSQILDLSKGNLHNSDIKFVPVVPSKYPFIGFEQVV